MHQHPERILGNSSCNRKLPQEMQSQSEFPQTSLTRELKDVTVAATRQCLREALTAEVLSAPARTPDASCVRVCPDIQESKPPCDVKVDHVAVGRGETIVQCGPLHLREPVRVYKQPKSNRTFRGSDCKGIGEGNMVSRDNPMMMEVFVTVLELHSDRIKVKGNARAEVGGRAYPAYGWIDKDGVT